MRGSRGRLVEGDVYDICTRIKELDPSLVIYANDETHAKKFSVVEMCKDHVERLVFTTDELDGRIISKLQHLLFVPFEKRFAEAERLEQQAKDDADEKSLNDLYENMGRPMLTDLERCGFIQRSVSYAKRGVAGGGRRAAV